MIKHLNSYAVVLLAPIFLVALPASGFEVPPLTAPVVDQAGLLSPSTEQSLNTALQRLSQQGGTQIGVLTMTKLDGLTIEEASIKVAENWKLGSAGEDNGVLLLVAKEERAMRIEVGQGREGVLTDAYARRIRDDVIIPRFRTGDFDGGVIAAVAAITRYTDPNFDAGLNSKPVRQWNGRRGGIPGPIVFILLVIILFLRFFRGLTGRRMHSRGWTTGSGWGGGGSSWGGGGGGWGGGGGGFSGGGASGRW